MTAGHIPVLMDEVMESLALRAGETYLDCTAGLGGHAVEAARRVGEAGTVVLNDLDAAQLEAAAERVRGVGGGASRVETMHGAYAMAPREMAGKGISADAVLADLGFSSAQMSDPGRGLSFGADGPLDMRFDPGGGMTAADLVNGYPEEELAEIIREYGEERFARRIAQKLALARQEEPITTTGRLASIVRSAIPSGARATSRIDPATRTFQALRIAVNDELGGLSSLLESVGRAAFSISVGGGEQWLRPGARIAVISFHSLEDRLVKRAFGELIGRGLAEPACGGSARSARAVEAGEEEVMRNPRARSAKLRAVRLRTAEPGR